MDPDRESEGLRSNCPSPTPGSRTAPSTTFGERGHPSHACASSVRNSHTLALPYQCSELGQLAYVDY